MSQTTTLVGRAKLAHPDKGFDTLDGGVALHAAFVAMLTTVSNGLPSRWTGSVTLADTETSTVTHNFNLALAKLKIIVFEAGVQLTDAQVVAAYTVTQASLNAVNIQNISGGPKTFDALVLALRWGVTNEDLDSPSMFVSDVAYDQTTWDGVTAIAPSKNAMKDKIITMDALIAGKAEISGTMPALTGAQDVAEWLKELTPLHTTNVNTLDRFIHYAHGATVVESGYNGAVYSPLQNRIYLVPSSQSTAVNWHYIDCDTGNVVAYAHGITVGDNGYRGGIYCPVKNRIYFNPDFQATMPTWHYIDCNTGSVVAYAHGLGAIRANAYAGGVFAPTLNRIYFCPDYWRTASTWHYIDCATGNWVGYGRGAITIPQDNTYFGAAYSPTQNRVYFIPAKSRATYVFIDCETESLEEYNSGIANTGNNIAKNGVYSPSQNRIYLVPAMFNNLLTWHYIDCDTGNIVSYANEITVSFIPYSYGVYSPINNRIYFLPQVMATYATWHYIDCNTGNIVAYAHGVILPNESIFTAGTYSPTQNRIYLTPDSAASSRPTWYYIQMTGDSSGICRHQFGSTILSSNY